MKKYLFSIVFIRIAVSAFAQKPIPAELSVPAGNRLLLHVYAKGVQIYRCIQDEKDTAHYTWVFQEPKANLYADAKYTVKTGSHYLNNAKNATWELSDGGVVSGTKLKQASPDSLSIPWLLLQNVPMTDRGGLKDVVFIQRLYTSGGIAPVKAGSSQKGKLAEIPYTAEYLFYK